MTNIKDVHSGVKEVWISEDEDFTKGVQKHALTSANSQKVNYTLVVKSTFLEHFADRTVYVKLIDNVGNYSIWYVVIDDVMEIRRILYSRCNEETLLE